ncbi:N-acetylmuramoyl-L-alanine amidase [Bacillus velezensis]|nr:N-acetylmuramoyl-L-alanine amidase [Bacillus velezensis]NMV97940.1 N-acetylmuramoyl-L-alanine amidase [Bacillus velezensis]
MSIQARQMLVSPEKYSIKGRYAMTAEYITFHNTANDASANNEISYMRNNNETVSYHFAVDDKEVVQGLPTNRNAFHCGDGEYGTGNRKSIGVEVCYSKSGGERYRKAEALAIKFIAQLLKERGWDVDRVKKHQDWSGKYCPHRVLDEGRWNAVKAAIAAELKALGGNTSSSSSKPTKVVKTNGSYVKNTVIADSLNVRTQRNANSSIVLALPKGSTVQYQKGSTQNGWGYIKYTNSKGATYSGYVNVSYIKSDAELGKGDSKPKTTPSKSTGVTKKQVVLPASASSWRIYPLGKAPVKANALPTQLNPKKFGGLTYDILDNPQTDVYTIKTDQFGKVNIYAAASTGAKIVGTSSPKSKSTSKPNSSGVKSAGKIKIVGVKSAAIVMDRPDKNKAKNLGTVKLGDTLSISGSVKGSNNARGYWEVIYKGKRGYISGQFGSKI